MAKYVEQKELPGIIVKGKRGIETQLFNETWNISFLCDGIIKYRGELYIIEFKTEVSRKFVTRNDVDEDHKRQAIAYSLSLGLDKIIFVYENRDTCEKKCYLLEITEK